MANPPKIHVLSKANYEEQHIIALPSELPLPPLSPSSLRVKSKIISLTTNNLSYARAGHMLGWWDLHPLPSSIPKQFSDPTQFGRISAWGYGIVIESTAFKADGSPIETGTLVFGYLPIGTLPVDLHVQIDDTIAGQFVETSKHRENVFPIYNRYQFNAPSSIATLDDEATQNLGYDSLFQVLFETGYLMNRFVFAWEDKELVHPSNADDGWTLKDGKIEANTTVLIFSPSGKTSSAFAHQLRRSRGRPAASKARMVVGIGSEASREFTEGTGLYDLVLCYDSDSTRDAKDLGNVLSLQEDAKIVICDFGSRGGAADRWAEKLRGSYGNVVQVAIGGEVVADSPEVATRKFLERMKSGAGLRQQLNASALRSQALALLGAKKYFEDFQSEWELCKQRGVVEGVNLIWGNSMEDVERGWERLCKGDAGPEEGLVYMLDD